MTLFSPWSADRTQSRISSTRPAKTRRKLRRRRRLFAEQLEHRRVLAATPFISEFLAVNSGGLDDQDGDSSDWIEIYNPTVAAVDLDGWFLTDDSSQIQKWSFPATTLGPSESIVVFASGKDRSVSGSELHTNFQLSGDGEYLALADASGVVISDFAPEYPEQFTNVSYGNEFTVDTLVESGSDAKTLIPTDNSLGSNWQQPAFDDSSWTDTPVGVGYGVVEPGFSVRYVKARSSGQFNGVVNSLTIAEQVLATPEYQSLSVTEHREVINLIDTGGGGNFGNNLPFPNQNIGDGIDHFVIEATATIDIPVAGPWTFGVNSDDGFGLALSRNGTDWTSSFPGTRGARDTIATFSLPEAGEYEARLVMFEAGGGASVEFFAAQGTQTTFSPLFDLVGDVDEGGLAAYQPYQFGVTPLVVTDIQSSMSGVGTSAYLRIPFDVSNANEIESLTLGVRYDDGFIAYLNGVEVASRFAPPLPTFNSTSLTSRDPASVIQQEQIVLGTNALSAIQDGTNILAFHGLNDSLSDASFLIEPELTGVNLANVAATFFATPTPGELNSDPIDGVLKEVEIDVDAGFYGTAQTVSITSPDAIAQIMYTTDGSEPTSTNGTLYEGPITIDQTTVLRANAVAPQYKSPFSVTRTYLFLDDVIHQSSDGSPPPGWPSTWKTNFVDYGMDPDVLALEGAERVKDALKSLPTLSLSTDLDNLFDPEIGIYSNARQDGRDWERPTSAEWINPDGSEGFQVNAGLRIRGGYSRGDFNPKHALKLFFRGSYGDSTLNYPVHGDVGVDEFKKLDLRTAQNYSWSSSGNATNNFIAEVFARYNQRDLGQPYTRSTWVHLYLNGQYWGLYQTQERADANFGESYFGGDASNYDVLKPERGDYRNIATDGNFDAYTQLWQMAYDRAPDGITPAFVDHAEYMRAQGKNPDGSDNLTYPVLLDVDNLIVYMLETLRGGNLDAPISNFLGNDQPNNYFAVRDRTGREGFRFFQHDAEHTMRNVNQNRNGPWNAATFEVGVDWFNPQWLHQQLMANDEYRMRFADTVQSAFFNDGPLSQSALLARLNEEVAKIEFATIAESARWGDAKRNNNPPRTQADFLNAINGLRNNYIPQRESIVLNQFRNTVLMLKDGQGEYTVSVPAPLFPSTGAPGFLIDGTPQHGGQIAENSQLRFNSPDGVVYYTTDGSDPRLVGGGINPDAIIYDPQSTTNALVSSGDVWKYLDNGTQPSAGWMLPSFNDNSWAAGPSELGYGDGDESTVLSFGPDGNNKFITTYFRKSLDVDISGGTVVGATIRVKRDDGIAVYLNGNELFRDNLPGGALTSTTTASSTVGGANESTWFEFPIDPSLILNGNNTLAAEVHQISATSSDTTFDLELILDVQTSPPLILNESTTILSRALGVGDEWSAKSEAFFQILNVPADASNLRITEINFDPAVNGDAEYLELTNVSSGVGAVTIDLDGVEITEGPSATYTVPIGTTLLPGESKVIVHDIAAFTAAYPAVDPSKIIGQYTGKLSNGGERVTVLDAGGNTIADVEYGTGDPWQKWADGVGGSLELIDPANVPTSETGKPYHYRGSVEFGGSPAATGQLPSGVLVSEVLAHTDPPLSDTIELYNSTGNPIDLSGWFLSDSGNTPAKYVVPAGTIIPAGGYVVFDESEFNPALPDAHALIPFALSSSQGDSVWLFSGDGVEPLGLQDHVPFDASFNGTSMGILSGSAGRLVPLENRSFGTLNGMFQTSPLVVSELHYHPAPPTAAALAIEPTIDGGDLEFIEIQNASQVTIDLTDWRLRGESDFDFPTGASLESGEIIVITNFDPHDPLNANRLDAFRQNYSIDNSVRIDGPYSGSLNNSHGLVKLQAPDSPPIDNPTLIPRVTVDEVFYDDLAPWPTDADGSGSSLQRSWPSTLGNYHGSWTGGIPTPGGLLQRPSVESVLINGGNSSRSSVTGLTVKFDQEVDLASDAISLVHRETDQVIPSVQWLTRIENGKTVVDVTFGAGQGVVSRPTGNSLENGTYMLNINADGVVGEANRATMAEDYRYGAEEADRLFRLFGDDDGDRDVDGLDLGRFGQAFLKTSSDSGYDGDLDFDGDGDIDGLDLGQFGQNFLDQMPH